MSKQRPTKSTRFRVLRGVSIRARIGEEEFIEYEPGDVLDLDQAPEHTDIGGLIGVGAVEPFKKESSDA